MRRPAISWMLSGAIALLGCTGVPSGVTPVTPFDVERYLGTWYEIARLDHRFERGLQDISATYALRDDGGISVRNRGYDVEEGEWREALGRAYPVGEPDVASLKVSFFGPFYGGYHVIELDREGYQYALVSGPDRDYLWILARERRLDPAVREQLLAVARDAGYEVDALIWVEHERVDPTLAAGANR